MPVKLRHSLRYIALLVFLSSLSASCSPIFAQAANVGNVPPAYALPNGLRVLTRERHVSPLVAIDLWVRAGAREETEAEDGCAHFLEHTLFKGTKERPAGQADVDIENLGATLTAATGPDYAHFYTTVAAAHVSEALNVLADVVRNAALPPVEVERERGVILDELAARDSRPTAHLIDALYERAFPKQPYGHSPGGSASAIRLRSRDTLATFYARTYRPDHCVLVFAGDITTEQARELARQTFAMWQNPAQAPFASSVSIVRPTTSNVIARGQETSPVVPVIPTLRIEETSPFTSELTGLALPGPLARDASMAAAAQIVAEVLGDSREYGRLYTTEFARAYIAARYTPRMDGSLWLLTAQEPESRVSASRLAQLRSLIADLSAHPPTPAELQAARGHILGRMQADMETNAGLAYAVGYAEITNGEAPEILKARLRSTTSRDAQQFIMRYLLARPGLSVHLAPAPPITERHL